MPLSTGAAVSSLGQSTHCLNVYSPAEAEREYSKSCEQNLEPSHLDNDGSTLDPNVRRTSNPPTPSIESLNFDDEEMDGKHANLKKIKSKIDDDDELFRDIVVACESQSVDLNELMDEEGLDDAGRIVAAVSMELERRQSVEMLKSPLAKKLSSKSEHNMISPVKGSHHSKLKTSMSSHEFGLARDYAQPSPTTQRCFEEFAKASVPRLVTPSASDMGQINTQSLPRTREHTDTLDRGEMVGDNVDTLQRYKGLMSPAKDLPVTLL